MIAHLLDLRVVFFDPSFQPLEKVILTFGLVDGAECGTPIIHTLHLLEPQLLPAAKLFHRRANWKLLPPFDDDGLPDRS